MVDPVHKRLSSLPGIAFMPDPAWGRGNCWLISRPDPNGLLHDALEQEVSPDPRPPGREPRSWNSDAIDAALLDFTIP